MAGYIHEFFGYRFDDHSDTALKAAEKQFCPFIGELCTKPLGRDGERSGACTIRQSSSPTPVICCPHRLYADEYKVLHIIAERTFGRKLTLYPGRRALAHAHAEGGAVAIFGHNGGKNSSCQRGTGSGTTSQTGSSHASTNTENLRSLPPSKFRLSIQLGTTGTLEARSLSLSAASPNPRWG